MSTQESKKQWWHNLISPDDRDLPGLKFRYLMDFLRDKNGHVLEIGCASGKNLRSIHEYNKRVELYGIDIDQEAISEGKKYYSFIHFECGAWERLPYEDAMFDFVVISDYIEHVTDFERAMNELSRVIKIGGYVHAFVPCEWQPWGIYWIFKRLFGFNVKETGGHTQFFSRAFLERAFLDCGFDIIERRYSYHLFGQIMDFCFYALLYNRKIAELWWNKNRYYHSQERAKDGIVSRIFNFLLMCANRIAYSESRLLWNVATMSTGIHLVLKKR